MKVIYSRNGEEFFQVFDTSPMMLLYHDEILINCSDIFIHHFSLEINLNHALYYSDWSKKLLPKLRQHAGIYAIVIARVFEKCFKEHPNYQNFVLEKFEDIKISESTELPKSPPVTPIPLMTPLKVSKIQLVKFHL